MRHGSHKRGPGTTLWGLWFALVFAVMAALAVALACVVPGESRRRRWVRATARAVFRLTGSGPTVHGLERLPDTPAVAVANHASYLDGILLTAVLPERYHFVIKREVTQVPVMHFLLRRVGAHFVDRFDNTRGASDLRRIMATAGSGGSLAFFPEGTFRPEPGLRRFHNGAFAAAKRGGMPLVPVAIVGTRRMLPAGRALPMPARLAVHIGDPVLMRPDGETRAAIETCRARILAVLDEPDLAGDRGAAPDAALG